jgi:RHS repeat-associated protein
VYGPQGLIAARKDSIWYYVQKDHLGSIRLVFDTTAAVANSYYDYDVYGKLRRSTENVQTRYRFTGQELDLMSGLYNFRARQYDGDIGIFYAADPANASTSPYGYVSGNPVSRIDPTGMVDWTTSVSNQMTESWWSRPHWIGPYPGSFMDGNDFNGDYGPESGDLISFQLLGTRNPITRQIYNGLPKSTGWGGYYGDNVVPGPGGYWYQEEIVKGEKKGEKRYAWFFTNPITQSIWNKYPTAELAVQVEGGRLNARSIAADREAGTYLDQNSDGSFSLGGYAEQNVVWGGRDNVHRPIPSDALMGFHTHGAWSPDYINPRTGEDGNENFSLAYDLMTANFVGRKECLMTPHGSVVFFDPSRPYESQISCVSYQWDYWWMYSFYASLLSK